MRTTLAAPIGILVASLASAQEKKPSPAPLQAPQEATVRWNHPAVKTFEDPLVGSLRVPAGHRLNVFARDVGHARMLLTLPDGTVLMSRPRTNDVVALRDSDGDGRAESVRTVASRLPGIHGLAFREGKVYLAGVKSVWVADLQAEGGLAEPREIVSDLPDGGQHGNRTIGFDRDGMLYVSVGSSCNDCQETNPEHATLLRMKADGSERAIFARGLRNTIGFAWHPITGELWGADHGSDWRSDDTPPEEINRIGQGGNYGWPYCAGRKEIDPTRPDPPGNTKQKFCADSQASALELPAHSAPIGLVFYDGPQFTEAKGDAFIALRGSWNRGVPREPKIARVRFAGGRPTTVEDVVTGFQSPDGRTRLGRLAGLAVATDGALLFTDDENGVVYRLSHGGGTTSVATSRPAGPPSALVARIARVEGFKTPESVLHDSEQDVYFVSSMAGKPTEKDGNGYISRLKPTGGAHELRFIASGTNGVTLNAPKGLALVGDRLWVTDIDVVRSFDRHRGTAGPVVDLAPLGAVFLNDIAAGPDGVLYVSDSGLRVDASGLQSHTGPDRIFRLGKDRQASIAIEGEALRSPNGLLWEAGRLLIAQAGGKQVLAWQPGEKAPHPLATGPGQYDGVAALPDGRTVVTSHYDSGLYVIKGDSLELLFLSPPRPGDIGADQKRGRLLVPSLDGDWVDIWQVPEPRIPEPRTTSR